MSTSNQKKQPIVRTWEELKLSSTQEKKKLLKNTFPDKLRHIVDDLIEESNLDYNDLMLPTLALYALVTKEVYAHNQIVKKEHQKSNTAYTEQINALSKQVKNLQATNSELKQMMINQNKVLLNLQDQSVENSKPTANKRRIYTLRLCNPFKKTKK